MPPKSSQSLPRPSQWEEMLTPREFAKVLKVSLSWLAKARKKGDGPPFYRAGRSIRYYPLPNACTAHRGVTKHGMKRLSGRVHWYGWGEMWFKTTGCKYCYVWRESQYRARGNRTTRPSSRGAARSDRRGNCAQGSEP